MDFLKNSQTNWKYILIVVILAIIVGGGIFGYTRNVIKEIISLSKISEIKKPEKKPIVEPVPARKATVEEMRELKLVDVLIQLEGIIEKEDRPDCFYWLDDGTRQICVKEKDFEAYVDKIVIVKGYYSGYNLAMSPPDYFGVREIEEIIETADWKTYKNEEYKFEIKYHKKWVVRECNISYPFLPEERDAEEKDAFGALSCVGVMERGGEGKIAQINVYNSRGLMLTQWIDFYEKYIGWSVIKREPISITNLEGIKGIYGAGEFSFERNVLLKENKIYAISFWWGGMEETWPIRDEEGIYYQMLSTFRFLE